MDNKQADITILFDIYCDVHTSPGHQPLKAFEEVDIDKQICNNKQIAYNYLHDDITDKKKLFWMNKLFADCGLTDYDQLLIMIKNESEPVRTMVGMLILDKEKQTRKLLEELIPELEEDQQGWANRILMYWDYLKASPRKIKITNKKEALNYSSKHIEFYCSQQITWVPQKLYSWLHWAGEEDMDEYVPRYVVRYILGEYMTLPRPTRIHACDAIAALINPKEWHDFLEKLYQYWHDADEDVNQKAILAPYCMYVRESDISRFRMQIRIWAREPESPLLRYSFELMAARATTTSLTILNEFMELSTNETVRRIATESFRHAANLKRLSIEELADKAIPSLGFNRQCERKVSYGTRGFKLKLLPDMSISVYDMERKMYVNKLPQPAKKDNLEIAEEIRREITNTKRLVNTQTHIQKHRLERALLNRRTWPRKAWMATFSDNPFMRFLAPGLIWGVYKDNQLQESFLCMENTDLLTINDNEYIMPNDAVVSLVHPIDLTDEQLTRWKDKLDQSNIVPFISQLSVPIFRFNDIKTEGDAFILYTGKPALLSNIYEYENKDMTFLFFKQALYIIDRTKDVLIQIPYIIENNNSYLKEMYFSPIAKDEYFSTIELPRKERLPLSSLPQWYISNILYMLSCAFPLNTTKA